MKSCLGGMLAMSCALVIVSATGCQTYERQPLDLASHRSEYETRDVSDDRIATFAERLAIQTGRHVVFDPSDGLCLAEAEVVALVFNPRLRLLRTAAGVTAAHADQAGLWSDPVFEMDLMHILEDVSNPWSTTLGLEFTIPISGRLDVEKRRTTAAHRVELYRIAEEEWATRLDLRRTWSKWSAARLRVEQIEATVDRLSGLADAASQLADRGELDRVDAALFALDLAQRRVDGARWRGEVALLHKEIAGLLGMPDDGRLNLVPALATRLLDETVDLEQTSLELQRLRQAYELAEATLEREVRKQYPDLQIGPAFEKDEGQSKIGFLGAIPLPILNRNRAGIAVAQAERARARVAFETAFEQADAMLSVARSRLDAIVNQRAALERDVVPLVDQQMAAVERLFELGEVQPLVLLESLGRASSIKIQLVELHLQEALGEVDVALITGPAAISSIEEIPE